jgi:hypothetical protein
MDDNKESGISETEIVATPPSNHSQAKLGMLQSQRKKSLKKY